MRLVLDTNTVVSALLWRGTPHRLVEAIPASGAGLFSSAWLLAEFLDALGQPQLVRHVAATGLSGEELLAHYRRLVTVIEPAQVPPTVIADPDDDNVLACAVAARADLIVSGDRQLLALKEFRRIAILNAAQAFERISSLG